MRSRPFLGRLMARSGPRGFLEVPRGPSKARQRRGSNKVTRLHLVTSFPAHTLLVYYVPTDRILLSYYILPCAIYARGVLLIGGIYGSSFKDVSSFF